MEGSAPLSFMHWSSRVPDVTSSGLSWVRDADLNNVCRVWLAHVSEFSEIRIDLFDEVERSRYFGYRNMVDSVRFGLGATMLRLIASMQMGVKPADLLVDRQCPDCNHYHGKPKVVGSNLFFSVSHSGDYVVVAATSMGSVGIDIEEFSDLNFEQLSQWVLASSEPLSDLSEFFTYWCRKEAVIKATGDGLRVPLPEVLVSPPNSTPRLISYLGSSLEVQLWDIPVPSGYAASLALLANPSLLASVELIDGARFLRGTHL